MTAVHRYLGWILYAIVLGVGCAAWLANARHHTPEPAPQAAPPHVNAMIQG